LQGTKIIILCYIKHPKKTIKQQNILMKTVLITGANKGIGFETAKQMAQLGYFVYLGSRDKIKGSDAIKKLNGLGILNVECIEIDVTNIDSIKQAKRELQTKIDALDILINNAAIAGEQPQTPSLIEMENLREVFETNFFGVVQTTQQFIDLLKKSKEPVIINVSSSLGSLTLHSDALDNSATYGNYDAYGCSKTALNAFTVMLAYEFRGTNFKINSVAPGYTATDLNQNKGTQTVDQAARIIVKYAALTDDGVTGKYFKETGEIPW
jgi:NAD(P)-dependent dehydrogenase (short-subunit alcohol dehydrogenase family)